MGLPDPSGDCCLDQQRQLAKLALQAPPPADASMADAPLEAAPAATPALARLPARRSARSAVPQETPPPAQQQRQPGLAGVLAGQLHAALPPAARRALEAQAPNNLMAAAPDADAHLSGQLAAASLDGVPSPTLLARLFGP